MNWDLPFIDSITNCFDDPSPEQLRLWVLPLAVDNILMGPYMASDAPLDGVIPSEEDGMSLINIFHLPSPCVVPSYWLVAIKNRVFFISKTLPD